MAGSGGAGRRSTIVTGGAHRDFQARIEAAQNASKQRPTQQPGPRRTQIGTPHFVVSGLDKVKTLNSVVEPRDLFDHVSCAAHCVPSACLV
jgi:hypothetical protein